MPAGATPSASSNPERVWIVPEALRGPLAERYGPVYTGPEVAERIRRLGVFAACGDRVTADALAAGREPLVALVDYQTQRREPIARGTFDRLATRRVVRVRNPAGMLTERLRVAVRELIAEGGGLIEVDGEEDLGALALVESLPAGATVIYGIPGAGVSFVTVDAVAQDHVRQLIERMDLKRLDLGR